MRGLTFTLFRIGGSLVRIEAGTSAPIRRYIKEHNRFSEPFVWTKPADRILAKLKRLPAPSE
ncbi:protein of unknown function [Magnetospirillum gryphiswaldense MSR-1 v2]|uniref:Transposase n=1 Tax=Magnetospirillum gryphiswaldense (strain DSM 6361 / JCM 21280 / NBRC 15271 / MSR-1) TaxID=431944 RepID=V6EXK1_MAGGM|nr:protein of unknown function [Magnetospirillum gryphiswaldense MSR-1 v2]